LAANRSKSAKIDGENRFILVKDVVGRR